MIDCVKPGEDEAIFIVEGIWQNRLATFTQHGNINVRDEQTRNTRSTALTFFDLWKDVKISFWFVTLNILLMYEHLCYVYSDDESSWLSKR